MTRYLFLVLFFCFLPGPAHFAESPEMSAGVREEYISRVNPVVLSEKQIRYFTRQFKNKCSRCHGKKGDGQGKKAKGAIPPADFTDSAFMNSRTDVQFYNQIEKGGQGKSSMPAYGPGSAINWNEEKIWGMVAFIRRFSKASP